MGLRSRILGVIAASVLVLGVGPARAQPVLGLRFEMDPRIPGSTAWGDQVSPRVAASPTGTLVLWATSFAVSPSSYGDALRTLEGVLFSPGDPTPTRLAPFGNPSGWWLELGWDAAAAGTGFVAVYKEEAGIVAMRLSNDGVPLDDPPRVLLAASTFASVEDLDCDPTGQCLLVVRVWQPGLPDAFETIAFGWDTPAAPPAYLAYAPGADRLAAVAHGSDGFLVAYLTDDVPEQVGVGGRVSLQRFDGAGTAAGTRIDLDTAPAADGVRVTATATATGYAIVWTTNAAAIPEVRGARLDAQGQTIATARLGGATPADDGWPGAITSAGDDAIVFWVWPPAMQRDVQELVFAADGAVTTLPAEVPIRRLQSAGHDGQHAVVAGTMYGTIDDDIRGGWADGDIGFLSTADNSQAWPTSIAGADPGDPYALVSWLDRRVEPPVRFATTFAADGCPAAAPAMLDETLARGQWAAGDDGFLVLLNGAPTVVPTDRAGSAIAAPIALPLDQVIAAWSEPRGGFSIVGDAGLVFVDPDGTVADGPAITAPWDLGAGRVDGDGDTMFAVGQDPPLEPYTCIDDMGNPYPDHVRISALSATTGAETAAPVLAAFDCGTVPQVHLLRDGAVVVWRDAGAWQAGRIESDGSWIGPVALDAGIGPLVSAWDPPGAPTQVGDELWWLAPERIENGTRIGLAVVRTTLAFETIGVDPLPVGPGLVSPRLVPTAGAPTLLGVSVRPPPDSSLRLVGFSLDGGLCIARPPADGLAPDETATEPPAEVDDAGCCSTGAGGGGGEALLALLVTTGISRRRRRSIRGRPSRCRSWSRDRGRARGRRRCRPG